MNRSSITELICRHMTDNADRLYRLAFRYVKNEDDAMDIVQDAACKILQYRDKIKRPEYIDTMLYRVTINAALDFLRKHKRETVGLPLVEEGREDNYGTLYALDLLDVDSLGLDRTDRRVLLTLIEKFGGGPVGLETLAAALSEDVGTLEDVCEPYLLKNGFINRTPRGRTATELAYRHLGYEFGAKKQE